MMKKLMERKRNRLSLVRMWRFHVCVCGDTNNRENVGNQVNWLKNGARILDQKNPGLLWHLRKIILIEDIKAYDKRLGEYPPLLSPIPKCFGFFLLDLPWQMVIYFLVKFLKNVLSGSGGTYDSTKEDEVKKVHFLMNFTDNFYITVNFVCRI